MTNLEFHAKQTGSQLLAWISHFFSFLQTCSMHRHCTLVAFCKQFDLKTHVDSVAYAENFQGGVHSVAYGVIVFGLRCL